MQVIAENLANANSTKGADGEPYRRKTVVLHEAQFDELLSGVEATGIVEDTRPGRRVKDPTNPDADADGFVTLTMVGADPGRENGVAINAPSFALTLRTSLEKFTN